MGSTVPMLACAKRPMKRRTDVSIERIVLVLGLASSLCLVIAAFAAFGDTREAGWSHLNDVSARVRDNVREAWSAITKVDEARAGGPVCVAAASDVVVLWTAHASPPRMPLEPLRPGPLKSPNLFDVLMSESERSELEKHDLSEALAMAIEAASKDAPPEHTAQARLRAIQLAARAGRTEDVIAQWKAAAVAIDPRIVTGETSTLLLCLLAALPAFSLEERVAVAEPFVASWAPDRGPSQFVLPHAHARVERTGDGVATHFTWMADERELALREHLLDACGRPPAWIARFEHFDAESERAAFASEWDVTNASALSRESWTLRPAFGELVAVRTDGHGDAEGHIVLRSAVIGALQSALSAHGALPAEFALDLDGGDTNLGEAVGPPLELGPAFQRVALRHPDVASILRRAEARTLWLRGGLIVLALFVAIAACATYFALRRERRLSEARTTFVANVSHELRTPLASILLMAENLESGRSGDNAPRYYGLLKREALRLRRLVDDVLDFSRIERGQRFRAHMDDVDVDSWYAALCADAESLGAQSNVAVKCERAPTPELASFDREALRRAVLNLVDNALRHAHSREIGLFIGQTGDDSLTLSVSDRGRGIPREERAAVFEPFTRLNGSESTPGAGLGLAIVREIVEAHGGRIAIRDPDAGPGVVFEIVIPIASKAPQHMEAAS